MKHISNVFDCVKDMDKSIETIESVTGLLRDFRLLWDSYQSVLKIMEDLKNLEWKDLDPGSLEDLKKSFVTTLK